MSYRRSIIRKYRFLLFYIITFIISVILANYLNKIGINENLLYYYDFVGDILNFSSILTGFLGAVISILTSISKSSPIITRILKNKKALKQFIWCMAIPFCSGIFTIIVSMFFRILLQNPDSFNMMININVLLLFMSLFFVFSSVLMTIIIFYIFFLDGYVDENNDNETNKVVPRLK
ncbi:hypothetical protein JHE06_05495 [Carnobacterium sp. CS13]|uniref:hypothetical protein n=1 Tax=Carnobacterium sp. CS13 TaxID=2800128 RepID=UPI0019131141|nr:hypothetical protein [Carnobacterium sp. CS13]QQP71225.1 hypothetical protein JHE06_05495 [Carnobacterium sp. CS13]